MTLRLAAVLLCGWAASAQVAIDPARYQGLVRYLDPQPEETPFACHITAIPPALNFSFRFAAGYVVRVPLEQFRGPGHRWETIVEIAPAAGGKPVYFGSHVSLPDVPATRVSAELGGGYLLGEGRYRARVAMLDERRRVCRRAWAIEVKPHFSERRVRPRMAPNSVGELTFENILASAQAPADAPARSLTILLDVAPTFPRRVRLRPTDRMLLLMLVSAVVESIPARRVRLVAFSLDQQKELFRRDTLAPGDLQQLGETLQGVELATVDYHVLQDPTGYQTLLGSLAARELRASPSPDTVLFLGPAVRYQGKLPAGSLEGLEGSGPHIYYFQYRPVFRRPVSYLPDIINSLVSRLKGRSFVIRTPADFQKAIYRVADDAR